MMDSSVQYHAIPSLEDHSEVNDGDYLHYTAEYPARAQTKWTYFLLGCATLLPWNALINETSFFLSRMDGTPFYLTFSSSMSSVYMLSNLLFQLYSTFTSKQSSSSRRIFASVITMVILVTSLCLSTFIQGTPLFFFSFALFNAAVQAAASAYLFTAILAVAAPLGSSYLQLVISGQAAVAVIVSAVQVASCIFSLWNLPPESLPTKIARGGNQDDRAEEIAARIFFGVSTIFLGVTLVVYTRLTRQPFYKSVISALDLRHELGDADERIGLVDDRRNPPTVADSHIYQVLRHNAIFLFSIAYTFAVTLAVYPAVTVRVRSVEHGIHPLLFTAVHFLAFNTGDLIGRYSCSLPYLVMWSARKILAMSLLRTIFIPLLLICNIQRPATTIHVPPIISSDILFMIILFALGYTGGYVSSLALLAVSSLKHNPRLRGRHEDVEVAATLGGSFVIVGLTLGAFSSFGVQAMV